MNSEGCSALGRVYHQECFKCSTCKQNLGERFFSTGQEPSCEDCFQELHCTKCGICEGPVSSEGVVLEDRREEVFHLECLTCVKCSHPLDGKFFTLDGELICEKCIAKEVRTSNIYHICVNN